MAKRKTRKRAAKRRTTAPVAMVAPVPVTPELAAALPAVEKEPAETPFAFRTRVRCPRCGSPNTIATSTDGRVQYRRCRHPICQHTFKVIGEPI